MDFHEVAITPLTGEDGTTRYDLVVHIGTRTKHKSYETLESALDSFYPPISARVRSHMVEGVRGAGKPAVFCLEDAFEEQ
jgi:hypothetical protein